MKQSLDRLIDYFTDIYETNIQEALEQASKDHAYLAKAALSRASEALKYKQTVQKFKTIHEDTSN